MSVAYQSPNAPPNPGRWNAVQPMLVPDAGYIPPSEETLLHNGDTLWVPMDERISLEETSQQNPTGYECTLEMENISNEPLDLRLVYPDRLPRGAFMLLEDGSPSDYTLSPGGAASVNYSIVYPLNGG